MGLKNKNMFKSYVLANYAKTEYLIANGKKADNKTIISSSKFRTYENGGKL